MKIHKTFTWCYFKKPISVCKISFLNLSCFSCKNFSDWIKSLKERGMILIKRHKKVVFEMSSLSLARVCNFYCKRAPYLGVGQCFTVIEDTQIDKKQDSLGIFAALFPVEKMMQSGLGWARLGWVGHNFFQNVKKGWCNNSKLLYNLFNR